MANFIKDRNAAEQLQESGFVRIDFLHQGELQQLQQVYKEFEGQIASQFFHGIHMTTWMSQASLKHKIREELQHHFKAPCDRTFQKYRRLNHVFIVKNKDGGSAFPLHQDWSFVDETVDTSINLWVALQDTNKRNGGIYFVEGSHRLPNKVRGAGALSFNFDDLAQSLKREVTQVELKAGQAVLFYHSTVHGSLPNKRNAPRVIAANSIIGEAAETLVSFYDESSRKVQQYKVVDDFSYDYSDIRTESLVRPPNGQLINEINDLFLPNFTIEDILKHSSRKSWFQKLTSGQLF